MKPPKRKPLRARTLETKDLKAATGGRGIAHGMMECDNCGYYQWGSAGALCENCGYWL